MMQRSRNSWHRLQRNKWKWSQTTSKILKELPRKKPKKTLIYYQMQEVLQICRKRSQSKTHLHFSRVSKAQRGNMRHHLISGKIMKSKKEEREVLRLCMGRTKVTQIIQIKTWKSQYHKQDHGPLVQTQRSILKLEIRDRKRVLMNRGCIH